MTLDSDKALDLEEGQDSQNASFNRFPEVDEFYKKNNLVDSILWNVIQTLRKETLASTGPGGHYTDMEQYLQMFWTNLLWIDLRTLLM